MSDLSLNQQVIVLEPGRGVPEGGGSQAGDSYVLNIS